jgi:hypothetical protein
VCIALNNFKCFEYYKAKSLSSDTKSGMTFAEEYRNCVIGDDATRVQDIYVNADIMNTINFIITVCDQL